MHRFIKKVSAMTLVCSMVLSSGVLKSEAATPMANWEGTIEENAYWPTPAGITYDARGFSVTPWKDYDIGFQGYSIDGEGRTVINLKFMGYSTANPNTVVKQYNYRYLQFKLDPKLNEMVDWDKSFVGTLGYQNDSRKNEASDKIGFANGVPAQKGVYQVDTDDLVRGGTYASRVWNNPIKLVLKEGKTVDDLIMDYVIQTRFLNYAQNMYLSKIDKKINTGINGYNAYTSSTIVPGKSNLFAGELENRLTYQGLGLTAQPPTFTQSQVIPIYDEENQKLYLYHSHIKQSSSYDMIDEGHIGYRISFDERFKNYLREENGEVGFVTMGNVDAQPYSNTKKVSLRLDDANVIGDSTIFQVGNNDFQKTDEIEKRTIVSDDIHQVYLHSASTLNNLFTVSVFNIDEERLKAENFLEPETMLESFGVKVAFVLDTPEVQYGVDTDGWSVYKYTIDSDKVIPANGKLTITTDRPFGWSNQTKQLLVRIGGQEGMTYTRQSSTGEDRGLTAVDISSDNRKFEISFREGATLKKNQTIEVIIPVDGDKNAKFTDNAVNLFFNGDEKTNDGTVKIDQTNPETFSKILPARVMENASKVAGVVFDRTLRPVVDEIFTDATEYTGNSLFPESTIKAVDITNRDEKTNKVSTTVGSEESPVIVNGRKYNYAYKFDNITLAGKLLKDRQIPFYNQDVGRLSSDNVYEQVQAKVKFNMTDNSAAKVDESNVLEKVAPLNKEYRLTSGGFSNSKYKPSGFAKLDKSTIKGAENLQLDTKDQIVPVKVTRDGVNETWNMINYINHNGQTYDIYADESATLENKSGDDNYIRVKFSANGSSFTNGSTEVTAYVRKGAKFGHVTALLGLEVSEKGSWPNKEYFTNTWSPEAPSYSEAIKDDTVISSADQGKVFYAKFSSDRSSKREGVDKALLVQIANKAREDLLKRQFPVEEEITIPDKKELIGWTTVRLTDDPVGQTGGKTAAEKYYDLLDGIDPSTNKPRNLLDEEGDWANAETEPYIYNEFSPIDKNRTVYAVYGFAGRTAENVKQGYDETNDKQFISGNLTNVSEEDPVDPNKTIVTIVDENGYEILDKNNNPIRATVNTDGTFEFVINDDNREQLKDKDVNVQVREESRGRVNPVDAVLDLQAPTFIEGKEAKVEVDPYGYQAKVNGEATDPSGILRFYAHNDKESGYYMADASSQTAMNNQIVKVENKVTEMEVVVIDKYGNKNIVKLPVEQLEKPLEIKLARPRVGKDFLSISTSVGAEVNVKILDTNNNNAEVLNKTYAQAQATDKVELMADGQAQGIKLQKGYLIKITASLDGVTKILSSKVR